MFNKILDAVWIVLFATLGCLAALMIFFLFVGKLTLAVAAELPHPRTVSGCTTDTECCAAHEDC